MGKGKMPDMFSGIDPVASALGRKEEQEEKSEKAQGNGSRKALPSSGSSSSDTSEKKVKVGFYISERVRQRLENAYLRARLAGKPIKSQSAFVEAAIEAYCEKS